MPYMPMSPFGQMRELPNFNDQPWNQIMGGLGNQFGGGYGQQMGNPFGNPYGGMGSPFQPMQYNNMLRPTPSSQPFFSPQQPSPFGGMMGNPFGGMSNPFGGMGSPFGGMSMPPQPSPFGGMMGGYGQQMGNPFGGMMGGGGFGQQFGNPYGGMWMPPQDQMGNPFGMRIPWMGNPVGGMMDDGGQQMMPQRRRQQEPMPTAPEQYTGLTQRGGTPRGGTPRAGPREPQVSGLVPPATQPQRAAPREPQVTNLSAMMPGGQQPRAAPREPQVISPGQPQPNVPPQPTYPNFAPLPGVPRLTKPGRIQADSPPVGPGRPQPKVPPKPPGSQPVMPMPLGGQPQFPGGPPTPSGFGREDQPAWKNLLRVQQGMPGIPTPVPSKQEQGRLSNIHNEPFLAAQAADRAAHPPRDARFEGDMGPQSEQTKAAFARAMAAGQRGSRGGLGQNPNRPFVPPTPTGGGGVGQNFQDIINQQYDSPLGNPVPQEEQEYLREINRVRKPLLPTDKNGSLEEDTRQTDEMLDQDFGQKTLRELSGEEPSADEPIDVEEPEDADLDTRPPIGKRRKLPGVRRRR